MNWDHAVSWGRGVWVSVSDIGRAGWVGLAVIYKPIILNSGPHSAQTLMHLVCFFRNQTFIFYFLFSEHRFVFQKGFQKGFLKVWFWRR